METIKIKITVTDNPKRNRILREMKSIKADESTWLKEVAWFLYC